MSAKTYEQHLVTVQNSGFDLQYVPKALQTEEICLVAVRNYEYALKYVSEALQTEEIFLAAVRKNGFALRYVPKVLQTKEICLVAVQNAEYALQYVSEALLKDPDFCESIVEKTKFALSFIPSDIENYEGIACNACYAFSEAIEYVKDPVLKSQIKEDLDILN